jgi:zinc protease
MLIRYSATSALFTPTDARYPRTIDERIAELKKVTLDDVKRFHSQFYGASNGVLIVLGQYEPEPLMKAAAELLGSWKSANAYKQLSTPFRQAAAANVKIETPDKQNALFQAGLRVRLSQDGPDYPALLIANSMFGGSLGARMPNRIRNVEGLSYSVGSRFMAPEPGDGALFSGSAISAPQNTPKVEASFKDELVRTLKSGFTSEELVTAKRAYRDQLTVARSQEQGLLRTIAAREEAGRTMKWDQEMDAKIQSLTLEQVNAAFRRHIDPDSLAIVKAGDFSKAGVYR